MKKLYVFIMVMMIAIPAFANPITITDDGAVSLTGVVDTVGYETFTIISNDERIEISMESIDDETMDSVIDTGIVKKGASVVVTGNMTDEISGPTINAEIIQLY